MSTREGFFEDESLRPIASVGESARVFERSRAPSSDDGKELCHHCCHPFDWQGLPMPIAYDSKRDAFTVIGNFCGIGCMKAYNGTRLSHTREINYTNISLFAKRCFGRIVNVKPAPPRNSLLAFGGTMTIEKFRAKSASDAQLVGDGPTVIFAENDSFKVSAPPDDVERRVPNQTETRADFERDDPRSNADDEACEEKKKKKPKASSSKKRPQRTAPPPTDDAVLKLKKARCEEPEPTKQTGMLAMCMGIEISEIPPER